MSVCALPVPAILSFLMPATTLIASIATIFSGKVSAVPISWFGWTATAIFTTSYLASNVSWLTRIQALASCFWIAYGIKIGSQPVIVANIIVTVAALISSFRSRSTVTE